MDCLVYFSQIDAEEERTHLAERSADPPCVAEWQFRMRDPRCNRCGNQRYERTVYHDRQLARVPSQELMNGALSV
jgi:hypothetical protein